MMIITSSCAYDDENMTLLSHTALCMYLSILIAQLMCCSRLDSVHKSYATHTHTQAIQKRKWTDKKAFHTYCDIFCRWFNTFANMCLSRISFFIFCSVFITHSPIFTLSLSLSLSPSSRCAAMSYASYETEHDETIAIGKNNENNWQQLKQIDPDIYKYYN